jgi:hypothetical protein
MENINRNPRQLDADVPEDKPQRSPRTDSLEPSTTVDIEHQPVKDDPRHWSSFKKVCKNLDDSGDSEKNADRLIGHRNLLYF